MTKRHVWTQQEIETLEFMRNDGATYQKISEALGTVSPDSARKKYNALREDSAKSAPSANPWSDEDKEILRQGYANRDPIEDISSRLTVKRTHVAIYSKADRMGITAPINSSRSIRTPLREAKNSNSSAAATYPFVDNRDIVEYIHAGLTPSEARLIHNVPLESMQSAFRLNGWSKKASISPSARISQRASLLRNAEEILGEPADRNRPDHQMVLLALAGRQARRDIAEVARLTILPAPWVERIFGRLDFLGIWPTSDTTSNDLTAEDYEMFSWVCADEAPLLQNLSNRY